MQITPIISLQTQSKYKINNNASSQTISNTRIEKELFIKKTSFKGLVSGNNKFSPSEIKDFMRPYLDGSIEYTNESAKKFVDFLYQNKVELADNTSQRFMYLDCLMQDVKLPYREKSFLVHFLTKLSNQLEFIDYSSDVYASDVNYYKRLGSLFIQDLEKPNLQNLIKDIASSSYGSYRAMANRIIVMCESSVENENHTLAQLLKKTLTSDDFAQAVQQSSFKYADIEKIMKGLEEITVFSSYQEQGTYSVDQILQIVNLKNINDKIINIRGERIGHFLPEIEIGKNNYQDINKINKIIKSLKEAGYDFDCVDDFGYTALQKAVESENVAIASILLNAGSKPWNFSKIKKYALESDNEDLKELFKT